MQSVIYYLSFSMIIFPSTQDTITDLSSCVIFNSKGILLALMLNSIISSFVKLLSWRMYSNSRLVKSQIFNYTFPILQKRIFSATLCIYFFDMLYCHYCKIVFKIWMRFTKFFVNVNIK